MTLILCATVAHTPMAVLADNDFNNIGNLNQDQFQSISAILGAATSYKAVSPAEPLGTIGFDVALELTATALDKELFEQASDDSWDLDYLPMAKVHLHKGLPFDLDVGAFLSGAPGTDIRLWGAELRYSFVSGNLLLPALAIRATYSTLEGVDEIELTNKGIEFSISKGFALVTPYAGIGRISTESEAINTNLDKETINETKLFAGFNLNLGLNFGFEIDNTGDTTSYSMKAGFRF